MSRVIIILNIIVAMGLVALVGDHHSLFVKDSEAGVRLERGDVRVESRIVSNRSVLFVGKSWDLFYHHYVENHLEHVLKKKSLGDDLVDVVSSQGEGEGVVVDLDVGQKKSLVSYVRGSAVSAGYGAQWRLGTGGLPKNSRQVAEGYWIGSQPSLSHMQELWARGIKSVLSATVLSKDVIEFMALKGMRHIDVKFGGKFPRRKDFLSILSEYSPEEVYIHCEHGGDRSGSLLAYLLVLRHGWSVEEAFMSVAFPSTGNLAALSEILRKRGFSISEEALRLAGGYSAEYNGGFGGLKAGGKGYYKMINTTIDAIHHEQSKSGRHK